MNGSAEKEKTLSALHAITILDVRPLPKASEWEAQEDRR